ncbi:hypothetical protein [Flavisolibacter tropicus]|uniref:Macroglobulin domain-containing protein n=1 Tax=Flavisolibacter tropicus TaxID=1492898 RepID=A0A172TT84_9BACT|nr:hypothetical protein [Flavisolibacter tropicus]ANE50305.1 hypothetical protein SY85_07105 [Flavisolibacter tropicus]
MKRYFTLLCFICFYLFGIAQNKAEEALKYFQDNYPLEKVFIQYNKTSYIAGEKMWFKGYVFSEYSPSSQSTNLYVELYSQQKQLLDRSIIPLLNGAGEGSFSLNKQLDEGVYYIRAYTSWMLNYDENFPYLHQLVIYNPESAQQVKVKPVRWDAKAFAESGQLIAAIENKVSIRLFSETFLPTSWSGVVKERDDPFKIVAHFTSFNEEISAFDFTPEAGKAYVAVINDNLGHVKTISLPDVKHSGILLKVQQQADTMICKVVFKNQPAKNRFKLIGQMQNQLVCQAGITNLDSIVTVKLPAKLLTDGIIHFTLFDNNDQPLTERLSFFHVGQIRFPELSLDSLSFNKRSLNVWKIGIDSASFYTYSMFVADDNIPTFKDNLLSSLLLSNDITIQSAKPAWYFPADDSLKKGALDAFLITEKWRWFTWQNMLNGRFPRRDYKEEQYLSFTGTVFNGKKLQLNKDINLLFQFRDSSVIFQQVSTDSTGAFQINGALFEDTIKVFYKINSKKVSAQNVKVLFERNNQFKRLVGSLPAGPYYMAARKPNDSVSTALQRSLDAYQTQFLIDNKYKNLQEVVVKAKRKSAVDRLNDSLSTLLFHSANEVVYDFVNEDQHAYGYSNIMDWIRMRVPGASTGVNYARSVYIDEISVSLHEAYTLPVSDVAMVKVFRNFTGRFGEGQSIAIYTRRGYRSYPVGLPQGYLVGYKSLDNYTPFNYGEDGFEQVKYDAREVLYWNTSMSSEKGSSNVRFYNNDITKSYRIVVMGFTNNGLPVYMEKVIVPR